MMPRSIKQKYTVLMTAEKAYWSEHYVSMKRIVLSCYKTDRYSLGLLQFYR